MFSKIEMNAHCEIHTLQIFLDNIKTFSSKEAHTIGMACTIEQIVQTCVTARD